MRIARCRCGQVALEARDAPIMTVACHCTSCQTAARQLESLPGGAPMLTADGGTEFMLFRKDRVQCVSGGDVMKSFRLTPKSATRRVVATCCNSAMFLEFSSGHWLSVYRDRFAAEDRLPIEMRTMTADRRPGVEFTDGVPGSKGQSVGFMWKLLVAWAAMGFRAPKLSWVKGELNG